jgi:hypothetical protein
MLPTKSSRQVRLRNAALHRQEGISRRDFTKPLCSALGATLLGGCSGEAPSPRVSGTPSSTPPTSHRDAQALRDFLHSRNYFEDDFLRVPLLPGWTVQDLRQGAQGFDAFLQRARPIPDPGDMTYRVIFIPSSRESLSLNPAMRSFVLTAGDYVVLHETVHFTPSGDRLLNRFKDLVASGTVSPDGKQVTLRDADAYEMVRVGWKIELEPAYYETATLYARARGLDVFKYANDEFDRLSAQFPSSARREPGTGNILARGDDLLAQVLIKPFALLQNFKPGEISSAQSRTVLQTICLSPGLPQTIIRVNAQKQGMLDPQRGPATLADWFQTPESTARFYAWALKTFGDPRRPVA